MSRRFFKVHCEISSNKNTSVHPPPLFSKRCESIRNNIVAYQENKRKTLNKLTDIIKDQVHEDISASKALFTIAAEIVQDDVKLIYAETNKKIKDCKTGKSSQEAPKTEQGEENKD